MMRALPALMLIAALSVVGCGSASDESPVSAKTETSHDHEHGATAPAGPESSAQHEVAAIPPDTAVGNEISTMESITESRVESVHSRNADPSGGLLHPAQVQPSAKVRAGKPSTIRSLMGPTITAGTRNPSPETFAAAAPAALESSPPAQENLPAVSLHECELFHNHRDGVANELTILYGTDRDRVDHVPFFGKIWAAFCSSLAGSAAATVVFAVFAFFAARKKALILASLLSGVFTLFLGYPVVADLSIARVMCNERKPGYGVGRDELQLGVCQVSVPPIHMPGELETTSILSLDVIPDPERHFLLKKVEPLTDEPFFAELRRQVARSPKKEVFVFVHGYNVTFEAAALRTAQMKSDLEFKGAACFYSWPSQGGLLQYTRDEENVRYTLTHLRQFLDLVVKHSGAESIHLIAHSMGNRAVTDVLKEIRLELGKEKSKLFNQIILAAPDVDAQVFVKDIAPRIKDTGERVTLYASSNDRALLASKFVHGSLRAGESGKGMVVVDGVETVDVSGIDCSFLGHSYYGDSTSVLADLALVLRGKRAFQERTWLTPENRAGLTFWRFNQQEFATARRLAQQVR